MSNIRRFAFYNRTLFDLIFIGIYALEQGVLIFFTFWIDSVALLSLIVSLFAVIVLTTFAIHKLVMESSIKYLDKELKDVLSSKKFLETENEIIMDRYTELATSFDKYLQTKSLKTEKGENRNKRKR